MMGLTDVKQPLELCCCVFDKGIKKKKKQPEKANFPSYPGRKGWVCSNVFFWGQEENGDGWEEQERCGKWEGLWLKEEEFGHESL